MIKNISKNNVTPFFLFWFLIELTIGSLAYSEMGGNKLINILGGWIHTPTYCSICVSLCQSKLSKLVEATIWPAASLIHIKYLYYRLLCYLSKSSDKPFSTLIFIWYVQVAQWIVVQDDKSELSSNSSQVCCIHLNTDNFWTGMNPCLLSPPTMG